MRCRSLVEDNEREVHCLRPYSSTRGGCRRSRRRTFANVGLGWLTGSRHAISILDLREVWHDKIPSRYRVKSAGASWSWFPQTWYNIQLWWRHLILLLYDTSRKPVRFVIRFVCSLWYFRECLFPFMLVIHYSFL